MSIQFPGEPIGPASGPSGMGGKLSPQQQAQQDLDAIQQIDQQLQQALADGDSPSQIEAITNKLQQPMQDLKNLESKLSPDEASVIDNMESQYQTFSSRYEAITPSNIALFQGSGDTVNQLLSAPAGAHINVQALEDQNQLTELTDALQIQMQTNGSSSPNCEALIQSMQSPVSDLQKLAKSGALTPDETSLVNDLSVIYDSDFQAYETTTPSTVGQFQGVLQSLNSVLLEG